MTIAVLDLPGVTGLLAEHPDEEVCLLVGLEGRRDDAVVAGLEPVTPAHLAHVNERRRLGHRRVVLEEVHVQRTTAGVFQLTTATQAHERVQRCDHHQTFPCRGIPRNLCILHAQQNCYCFKMAM